MNPREAAVRVLEKVNNDHGYSTEILKDSKFIYQDERDGKLLRELVYGVLENRNFLDYIISINSNTKLRKLNPLILEILRMGTYQLIFLRIPSHAAINESVKLCKKLGQYRLTGFVNGVLRSIDRKEYDLDQMDLAPEIKYSHSKEIIDYFFENYDEEFVFSLLKANNTPAPMYVRVNTLKTTRNQLMTVLDNRGIICERIEDVPDGLKIVNPVNITKTTEFEEGYFFIQDIGSMMVAHVSQPKAGTRVLDLCAAPGSKTTHIAQLMENTGQIIANDVAKEKLHKILENCSRLGISNVKTTNYDGNVFIEEWKEVFDSVIVDAPCSGLGLIRKKPEIRWNRTRRDIDLLAKLQIEILKNAYKYLKKGGSLVYSTCTLGKKENQEVKEAFENEHRDMIPVEVSGKSYFELYPNVDDCDGFFICKFRKQ